MKVKATLKLLGAFILFIIIFVPFMVLVLRYIEFVLNLI